MLAHVDLLLFCLQVNDNTSAKKPPVPAWANLVQNVIISFDLGYKFGRFGGIRSCRLAFEPDTCARYDVIMQVERIVASKFNHEYSNPGPCSSVIHCSHTKATRWAWYVR